MSKFSKLRFCGGRLQPLAGACLAVAIGVVIHSSEASAQRRASAMAIDANTGEVLHASAADEPRFPASLTKMMTLYVVFGEIQAGRLSTASRIRISEAAASVPPSKLDLAPGTEIALADAMKALVTKSANDVAVAVAETVSGSEAAFAGLMTRRAREIGMRSTTFRNAHGLPHPEQVTTARDMLTLALRLQDDYPKEYRIFSLKYFTYGGETYRNHNSLLFHFQGAEGIKTGYTRLSGFNLVSSVKREGKHVVAVVFGGETAGTRNAHMRNILTRALAKASTARTRRSEPMLVASPKAAPRPAKTAQAKAPPVKPAPVKAASAAPAAPRPAPVVVAGHSPPSPSAPDVPPAEEAPLQRVSVTPPPALQAIAGEPATQPSIEIAMVKVRPVEPASPPAAAAPSVAGPGSAATDAVALPHQAAAAPRLDFNALRRAIIPAREQAPEASAPAAPRETIVVKRSLTTRAPGTLAEQMAILEDTARADPPQAKRTASPPGAAVPPPLPAASRTHERGLPPSTLNAQAARLSGDAFRPYARPSRLGGPPEPAADTFDIEIGTFASRDEAEARLSAVQSKTASVAGHAPVTTPVDDARGTVFRARFAGFDADKAALTCQELARAEIGCQVAAP